MSRSEATSLDRVTASPSARRGTLPSTLATVSGAAPDAYMRGGIAGADTIRSGAACRFASRAAHSTARSDSSEPSTPTTTGLVAMTFLLTRPAPCLQLAAHEDAQVPDSRYFAGTFGVIALATVVLATIGLLARRTLDKRRMTAWDAEWRATGPRWTTRA
jgi:hypothetical protein